MGDRIEQMQARVEALNAEIKRVKELEKQERQAKLDAVPVLMRYTVTPSSEAYVLNRLYDEAVVPYRVEGHVVNREEALAAGHHLDRKGGGMTWLFNTMSGRLVCDNGGGTVWFGFAGDRSEEQLAAVDAISAFIAANPDGGDITDIIEQYQQSKPRFG